MSGHASWRDCKALRVAKQALYALYAAAIVTVALAITVGGYSLGHIMSGSMDPTLRAGDWIIQHKATAEDMKVGKIITYTGHAETMGHDFVTHRIIATDGETAVMKGDANATIDPEPITDDDLVAVVVWRIPLPFGS